MRNKFYLEEFQFFDGEDTVVFNIVALEDDKNLYEDKSGLYFEYGVAGREHIHIDDFEEVE